MFRRHLDDANLWHLNRHSLSGAMGIGLLVAFLPIPFQMFLAAGLAVLFRVNLPLSVVLVWITNPLTVAPILLFALKLGAWALDIPATHISLSGDWLSAEFHRVWRPLLTGCLILSVGSACTGYLGTHMLWRLMVIRKWTLRSGRACNRKLPCLVKRSDSPTEVTENKQHNAPPLRDR